MIQVSIKPQLNDYHVEEAYKSLRTNIQFCGKDKKVISVTSCTPNEGKSSVSLKLAMELAKSGKRTLLIDADMRKSVLVGQVKGQHQEIRGLAHYLSGQSELQEVIVKTDQDKFYIVFAGSFPPNPSELLDSRTFETMLAAVRKVYDYVIIDTPPLGSVIDGAIIAGYSDGVILVIEDGTISYRFAQSVQDQLNRSNCPILGVVLNKIDMTKSGYGKYYGKYYRYYGGYGGYGNYGRSETKARKKEAKAKNK